MKWRPSSVLIHPSLDRIIIALYLALVKPQFDFPLGAFYGIAAMDYTTSRILVSVSVKSRMYESIVATDSARGRVERVRFAEHDYK